MSLPLRTSPDDRRPLFADRYKLDRRLGVGGMATVQLAFDTRLERNVAVKLLAEHLAEDASFVSRFRREALAAARLVHPNIVQVFDFGLDEATRAQLHRHGVRRRRVVRGDPARSRARSARARRSGSSARPAAGSTTRTATASCTATSSPGNLLRSRDNAVKLADFGIAKAAEQSDITKVGSVLGTAAYLSPEQARGEQAGPASDLYALGVVSYQLLANRLPYDAASLTDLARLQDAGPPPRLDELNPDVSPALADAVMVALHRDPEQRYADAADMEQALDDALSGPRAGHRVDVGGRRHRGHADAGRHAGHLGGAAGAPARRLEPLPEGRRARRRAEPPPARRSRTAAPAAQRRKRGGAGTLDCTTFRPRGRSPEGWLRTRNCQVRPNAGYS